MSKAHHYSTKSYLLIYFQHHTLKILYESRSLGFYCLIRLCFYACVIYLSFGMERSASAQPSRTCLLSPGISCEDNAYYKSSKIPSSQRAKTTREPWSAAPCSSFLPPPPCLLHSREQTESFVFVIKMIEPLKNF